MSCIYTPFRAHQLENDRTFFEEYVGVYLTWLPKAMSRYFSRSLAENVAVLLRSAQERKALADAGPHDAAA